MLIKNHNTQFLIELLKKFKDQHNKFINENLKLDLTRGKPSPEQLSLSDSIDGILKNNYFTQDNLDTRNYGQQEGITEARKLGASWLGFSKEEIIASDHSSLTLMYQVLHIGSHYGYTGFTPWLKQKDPVFIAVVPGYDRHFGIAEKLGIKMINVPLQDTGPDMDLVEKIVEQENVKGIFCVPKYSNPTGTIYDEHTIIRLSKLGLITGDDFKIIWDNAYAVHDNLENIYLPNIMDFCHKFGTQNTLIAFGSTSKVTHAGSGISFLGASKNNIEQILKQLDVFRICPNKVNQLRHVKFLKNMENVKMHMKKHAKITTPKFNIVIDTLNNNLAGKGLGSWTVPKGGYFISFDTLPGLAKQVVSLSADAGVKLTPAGSTFPYGKDPDNKNIRLAPTFPNITDLQKAMDVFVNCVYLASVEHFINNRT